MTLLLIAPGSRAWSGVAAPDRFVDCVTGAKNIAQGFAASLGRVRETGPSRGVEAARDVHGSLSPGSTGVSSVPAGSVGSRCRSARWGWSAGSSRVSWQGCTRNRAASRRGRGGLVMQWFGVRCRSTGRMLRAGMAPGLFGLDVRHVGLVYNDALAMQQMDFNHSLEARHPASRSSRIWRGRDSIPGDFRGIMTRLHADHPV